MGQLLRWHGIVGSDLTPEDVLLFVGDTGFGSAFMYPIMDNFIARANCTMAFVDGNHEDHLKLSGWETREMFGADVGVGTDGVIHLRRGRVYTINGRTFFCYGGAQSVDVEEAERTAYVDWWPEEVPTQEDFERALDNLIAVDFKVDCILTHTAPKRIISLVGFENGHKYNDPTAIHLTRFEELLRDFKNWYFGHFHIDRLVDGRFRALYNEVIELL